MQKKNEEIFDFKAHFIDDMMSCFNIFDKKEIQKLSIKEFKTMCYSLFQNELGYKYLIDEPRVKELFTVFDKNQDGFIDINEFQFCWDNWIKIILRPKSALLIIDVQNDFISGTMNISNFPAQHNAIDIIKPINKLLETVNFNIVIYSLDWHPDNHISFIDNVGHRQIEKTSEVKVENAKEFDTVIFSGSPPKTQILWPKHCVQDTWGSELHADLKRVENGILIHKGTNSEVDSYSAFWDNNKLSETELNVKLRANNITDVYVCGLAYDFCVGATALDSLKYGYRTIIVDDCSRGVDLKEIEQMKSKIFFYKGVIVQSNNIEAMVKSLDRRFDLGYKLGMELMKSKI